MHPTGLITTTDIDQIKDDGALQLNWNLEHRKFMIGASVDRSHADYSSSQQLGLLDVNHNTYFDPSAIGNELSAVTTPIDLNNFPGKSITQSLDASETWSLVSNLHVNGAGRNNVTQVQITLAVINTAGLKESNSYLGFYDFGLLCPTADPASYPPGNSSFQTRAWFRAGFTRPSRN